MLLRRRSLRTSRRERWSRDGFVAVLRDVQVVMYRVRRLLYCRASVNLRDLFPSRQLWTRQPEPRARHTLDCPVYRKNGERSGGGSRASSSSRNQTSNRLYRESMIPLSHFYVSTRVP